MLFHHSRERDNHLYGAQNANGNGQDPEREVLWIPRPQIGDQKTAEVEERVQKYAQPYIFRFEKHDGEHRADQKGVSDLLENGKDPRAVEEIDEMKEGEDRGAEQYGQKTGFIFFAEKFQERPEDDPAEEDLLAQTDQNAFDQKEPDKVYLNDLRRAVYQRGEREVYDRHRKGRNAP